MLSLGVCLWRSAPRGATAFAAGVRFCVSFLVGFNSRSLTKRKFDPTPVPGSAFRLTLRNGKTRTFCFVPSPFNSVWVCFWPFAAACGIRSQPLQREVCCSHDGEEWSHDCRA